MCPFQGCRSHRSMKSGRWSRGQSPELGNSSAGPFYYFMFFFFLFNIFGGGGFVTFYRVVPAKNELKQMSVCILLLREKGIYIGYSYYCNWGARIWACQVKYGQRQSSQYLYEKMPCHQFRLSAVKTQRESKKSYLSEITSN